MKTTKCLRKTERLQYEIFEMESLDATATMVAQSFIHSDPMAVVQKFSITEFAHYVLQLCAAVAEQGLTIIAREHQNHEVVGVLIAGDFVADSSLKIEKLNEDDKFQPIMQLFEQLQTQYMLGKRIDKGEYLHLHMLAVAPEYRGEKIAQNLVKICVENAANAGYQIAFAEAANSISQQVFRNCGFVARHEILYKQYTYHNMPIFGSIEGHSGTILMDKELN
ncbi:GNAT family N-acetyltransferase [Scytonema tolypothrichoides VB-61278]|nr:GNAT family N-acetyltransferase [Scytonema tolypothrichoides VB-61278]